MPARKVTYSPKRGKVTRPGQPLPPAVAAGIMADQLGGDRTPAETAAAYGVDPSTVRRLAQKLDKIDRDEAARITAALPQLYALTAGSFGVAALEALEAGDSATAVKLAFGSKLSAESGRIVQPQPEQPGVQMLTFIQSLNVTPPAVPGGEPSRAELGPVVDVTPTLELAPPPLDALPVPEPAPDDPRAAPDEMTPRVEADPDSAARAAAGAWLASRRGSEPSGHPDADPSAEPWSDDSERASW
jgi:hypothetical protein